MSPDGGDPDAKGDVHGVLVRITPERDLFVPRLCPEVTGVDHRDDDDQKCAVDHSLFRKRSVGQKP